MKLEPIAKPIRIRIKLGKSEFSSLDDVKRNFSIDELFPLFKDGRLERWLVQIGEHNLADKVREMSPNCGDGDIRDHILLLSPFFEEVSNTLDRTTISKESWVIPIESLSIYAATKGYNQNGLKKYLNQIIDNNNIISIFEDPNLHKVFSDSDEWGYKFADLVGSDDEYKHFFSFLEKYPEGTCDIVKIVQDFYNKAKERGFEWSSIYKQELTLDFVSSTFKSPICRVMGLDWGYLFAESLKDWDQESDTIINILLDNDNYLSSFYNHCSEKGIKQAADPWYIIAHSKDYDIVLNMLSNFDFYMYLDKYEEKIKTIQAQKLYKFIKDLIHYNYYSYSDTWELPPKNSKLYYDFLLAEREILIALRDSRYSPIIEKYKESNDLAKDIIDGTKYIYNISTGGKHLVNNIFVKKLKNAKNPQKQR